MKKNYAREMRNKHVADDRENREDSRYAYAKRIWREKSHTSSTNVNLRESEQIT